MSLILDWVLARPWALEEGVYRHLLDVVQRHADGGQLPAEAVEEIVAARNTRRRKLPEGLTIDNGVATIPITGVLAKLSSQVGNVSQPRGTSVEQIREHLQAALEAPDVTAIALDIDSPGGSVDGIPELADEIREAALEKPVIAYTDGMMASAAYWLASGATAIFATRGASVGSIGISSTVVDSSVRAANQGLRVDVVKAGAFKGVGVSGSPITADDRREIQRDVDAYYGLFVDAIATGRAQVFDDRDQVLELADGRTHVGLAAKANGLVDDVLSMKGIRGAIAGLQLDPQRLQAGVDRLRADGDGNIELVLIPECSGIDGYENGFTITKTMTGNNIAPPGGAQTEGVGMTDANKTATDEKVAATAGPSSDEDLAEAIALDAVKGERERIAYILDRAGGGQEALARKLIADGTSKLEALEALHEDLKSTRSTVLAEIAESSSVILGQDDDGSVVRENAPRQVQATDPAKLTDEELSEEWNKLSSDEMANYGTAKVFAYMRRNPEKDVTRRGDG